MRERNEDILHRYGISARNGFLPDSVPLSQLSDPYYSPWEELVKELPDLLESREARNKIDALPVLQTTRLKLEAEWRRAYVILGFLTHAYIWGGEQPSERLPPQLTCPFLIVSEHVGLPPTATYATLSLWNFRPKDHHRDITKPENLQSLNTFTGTKDEEWFYLISTAIEAKGSSLIIPMLNCIQAVDENEAKTVLSCLQSTTNGIKELGSLLGRMYEHCDPQVFYHNVRVYPAGTRGMATAGLPRGVFYDEGDGKGGWRQYSGGSNAQSSLIQLLDIFLAVDHHATGGPHTPSSSTETTPKANSYIQEMRNYMPRPHREFLRHISRTNNLREYITRPTVGPEVLNVYNEAVAALVSLRNIHIQIVARYIVMPSRSPPAPYIIQKRGLNLATASSSSSSSSSALLAQTKDGSEQPGTTRGELHGTGGTNLMPFLKRTRDETRAAALEPVRLS